jgi:hypothetical protein
MFLPNFATLRNVIAAEIWLLARPDCGLTPVAADRRLNRSVGRLRKKRIVIYRLNDGCPRGGAVLLATSLLVAANAGLAQTTRTVTPFGGCAVDLVVPEGWTFAEARNPQDGVQTIELSDPKKEVLLGPLFLPDLKGQLSTRASLQARMGELSQAYLEGSVEKTMELNFFDAPTGPVAWASFTDRSLVGRPIPEGQKLISTTGLRSWKGAFLFFTLLADSVETASSRQAMDIVRAAITLRMQDRGHGREAETRPDAIVVSELADVFELTVPISRLVLQIPRGGLRRATDPLGGSAEGRRYFKFKDSQNLLYVSGWFEPQDLFKGIDKFWADETSAWSNAIPRPEGVSFKRVGKWEVVAYNLPNDKAINPNIRAHWLQAGTWIDLHISMLSKLPKAEAAAKLDTILSEVRVALKNH